MNQGQGNRGSRGFFATILARTTTIHWVGLFFKSRKVIGTAPLLLFLFCLAYVPKVPAAVSEQASRSRATVLTKEEAALRSRQLTKVSYVLWFRLDDEQATFEGRSVILFDFRSKGRDQGKQIFLDLEGGSLRSVLLNGTPLKDLASSNRFDGHRIYFQVDELKAAGNRIEIAFTHPYGVDGTGLHRFVDPVDHRVYLYSHFEPYFAHRMFPCFDQPDLKASFELTVEAPKDWSIISSTQERTVSNVDGRKSWAFPPTPLLSTYVFSLHAGPYEVWKSSSNGISTRLFARKSLSKYVDYSEWLSITGKGLDFFGTQLGYPYPFGKYDQIIVPDFNAGAMENVGAVTFSEKFIYRTKASTDRHKRRANVILHEMAHMWFGNLVTMRWWNGLWLNESFATFMSTLAADEVTPFPGNWQSFFADSKTGAYWEDQLVTTHAIELPVSDTDHAEANFDGITYGKGAATLKQLSFFLGEDEFREGLQRYFQKFAFRTTSTSDFIKVMAEASGRDLTKWQKLWLQTAGVNTLKASWECRVEPEKNQSQISKFDLIQTGEELRPHRTQIGLFYSPKYKKKSKALTAAKNPVVVTYTGSTTPVPGLLGKPCPDLVFPNFQDYDYVKVELDSTTLSRLSASLSEIEDPMARQMAWHSLWEMVLEGKLRAQDYADLVLRHTGLETNTMILSKVLRTLADPSPNRNSVLKFLPPDLRRQYQARIEPFIVAHLKAVPHGSDLQLIWYQAFLDNASSPASVHFAKALLNKKEKLKGLEIDQEHRWELIHVLARNGDPGVKNTIQAELEKDPTDMGQKAAIAAEASIPDAEIKNQWLKKITHSSPNSKLPLAKLREAMGTYQLLGQDQFIRASLEAYFDAIPKLAASSSTEEDEYSKWFTQAMFPSLCEADVVQRTTALLNADLNLPPWVIKSLKVRRQEEERCIQAQQKSLASKAP